MTHTELAYALADLREKKRAGCNIDLAEAAILARWEAQLRSREGK